MTKPSSGTVTSLLPAASSVRSSDGLEVAKWIALVAMLVDHAGRYGWGLGTDSWAFVVGRLAFPIFACVLGINLARPGERGARAARVTRRLFVWAAVSVIPSWLARDAVLPVNVLATLGLGSALCWVFCSVGSRLSRWLLAGLAVAAGTVAEFGPPGVLLVFAAFLVNSECSQSPKGPWIFGFFCVAAVALLNAALGGPGAAYVTFAAVAVVPLARRTRIGIPRLAMLFYGLYPVHLLLIAVVR